MGDPVRRLPRGLAGSPGSRWSSAGLAKTGAGEGLSPEHGHTPHAGSRGLDRPWGFTATRSLAIIVDSLRRKRRQIFSEIASWRVLRVSICLSRSMSGLGSRAFSASAARARSWCANRPASSPAARSVTSRKPKSSAFAPKSRSSPSKGDLRREVGISIKRLMDLGCYRGLRHRRGLPMRGQRTRTNARTRKGPRKAIKK